MKFSTLFAIIGFSAICLSSVAASTGTFNNFTYTEGENTITIDKFESFDAAFSVVVPPTINGKPVVSIGPKAFFHSRSLKKVTIPSTVTSIGKQAFEGSSITDIVIPAGVTRIEDGTFIYCYNLKTVTIPSSVLAIGDSAFRKCVQLQVSIPTSVVNIGDSAFSECWKLSEITFSSNLKTIGRSAFKLTGLTSVDLPDSVLSVGELAFADCRRMTSAKLPKGMKHIPAKIFKRSDSLTSVKIPKGVVSIGDEAFDRTALAKIQFPAGLKTIGNRAFGGTKLTMVTFPKSLTSLGNGAFLSAWDLNRPYLLGVLFNGKAPKMGKNVFGKPWDEFIVSVGKDSDSFTQPRWKGYLVSAPAPEIGVLDASGEYIENRSTKGHRAGQTLIGKKGPVLRFTVINTGFKRLENLRAVMAGGNSKDFLVVSVGKSSLKPGEKTTVDVRMRPTVKGNRTAILRILSNDENEKVFDIKLGGIGLAPFN